MIEQLSKGERAMALQRLEEVNKRIAELETGISDG